MGSITHKNIFFKKIYKVVRSK